MKTKDTQRLYNYTVHYHLMANQLLILYLRVQEVQLQLFVEWL